MAIDEALAQVVGDEDDPRMVTAWVLAVEYVDSDGGIWLVTLASKDNPAWKRDGMLRHAMDQQTKVDQIATRLEED